MTTKDLRKIAVLMGGPGSEREVSMRSGAAITKALKEQYPGVEIQPVVLDDTSVTLPEGTDVVFLSIHGSFGEDGQLQAVLERMGVIYTGTDESTSDLAFDKIASKGAFSEAGVPTPRWEVVRRDANPNSLQLTPPLVVKPPREGSSVGVCIVKHDSQVADALHSAGKYAEELLVEDYIEGRELTVGILGDEVLPVIEIRALEGLYDYKNKYTVGGSEHIVPAELDAATTEKVQAAALAAHRALGVQVYSRVDVRLDESGEPWVLEVNTIPGMTATSLLPDAAAAAGYNFAALVGRIVELSIERAQNAMPAATASLKEGAT